MPKVKEEKAFQIAQVGDTEIYVKYTKGFRITTDGCLVDLQQFIHEYKLFAQSVVINADLQLTSMTTLDDLEYSSCMKESKKLDAVLMSIDEDFNVKAFYEYILSIYQDLKGVE